MAMINEFSSKKITSKTAKILPKIKENYDFLDP